eukprot:5622803-Amphidinium_carterae.2
MAIRNAAVTHEKAGAVGPTSSCNYARKREQIKINLGTYGRVEISIISFSRGVQIITQQGLHKEGFDK